MTRLILCLILFALTLAFAEPAKAAESRKEMALRIDSLQMRVDALENLMLTGDPAAVRLQQQFEALAAQLREQIGNNERLQFENRKRQDEYIGLQRTVDLLAKDLQSVRDEARGANAALGRFLTGEGEPAKEEHLSAKALAASDDEAALAMQRSYEEAKSYLEQGYFDQARAGFDVFVTEHGEHALSGPALFWLGEIAAVQGDFRSATNAYIETLKRFPKGSKAPEAMVKLGAALGALGDTEEACRTLKAVPGQYPKATAGVRARADIERRRAGCS